MDMHTLFGFRKTPFTREVSSKELFRLPHISQIKDRVVSTIEHRMSAVIIGPAGTGKTVALRDIVDTLPPARYDVRYVKVTGLNKRDMCREIARACGLQPAGTYPALVQRIQESLEQRLGDDGQRSIIILDEAHEMRPDVLGMLRILTNFEMDSRLVVSFVLAGQSALGASLKRDDMEDIFLRVQYFGALRLLSRDESQQYIKHRCAIAGAASTPFDDSAFEAIHEVTRGNMRAIDRLARMALEEAAQTQTEVVSHVEVLTARRNLWPV